MANADWQRPDRYHPSGQLGQERELVELLQIGSLALTKVSSSVVETFVPEIGVLSVPYLFRDDEHRWKVLSGPIGKDMLLKAEKYWLRGLCYYDAGNRSFYTKDRPVNRPEDLQGLKIRVQPSNVTFAMIRALNGSATPIAWGELYTALQQGVVDGAENNAPSFYLSGHYEVCKYYSLDAHTAPADILLIGTKAWYRLTDEQQNILQRAVDESVEVQKDIWQRVSRECLENAEKEGVKIIYPDKTLFQNAMKPLYEEFRENNLPFYPLIAKIQEVQ